MWGTLNEDVELPGVRLALNVVGTWEDCLGAVLGSLVELMNKAHDTQERGEVAIIVRREVVVDAGEEGGDEVGEGVVINCLEERCATRFVIMEVALFGEETIVQLKRMSELEEAVVRPSRDLNRERGVKPGDSEFQNTPQEIIAVVRLHTDHVDE